MMGLKDFVNWLFHLRSLLREAYEVYGYKEAGELGRQSLKSVAKDDTLCYYIHNNCK
jgi:hypothetical protein